MEEAYSFYCGTIISNQIYQKVYKIYKWTNGESFQWEVEQPWQDV